MSGKLIALVAALAVVAIFCGCVGYFHYHPVKSTEQMKAEAEAAKLFSGESFQTSGEPFGSPAISGVPVAEELLIKEEALIK